MDLAATPARSDDSYLHGPGPAWFAFAMTLALMVFDYVDRQIIVSLFPHMKADWGLSDKQLGALVSVVSVSVALGALPVALVADRFSRVRSVVVMATAWSLASIACMVTRNYGQLLVARAVVGLGEAGYGSVGAALIASHFPARLRGALMAAFFASASIGSVLGVLLGGVIASRWGWQAAFGVVGVPGLVLALMYLLVRDYPTAALDTKRSQALHSPTSVLRFIARALASSRTLLWVCVGGAAQLIVVSAVWSWLPSFLNRVHGLPTEQAALRAALVVLAGAAGGVVWGALTDRAARRQPRQRLRMLAALCLLSLGVLVTAFGAPALGLALTPATQFGLVLCGGLVMTCTVGPASVVVMDVVHPGVRATGAAVLSLFQNLFGLALGPVIAGGLSDALGLATALTITPLFGLIAVWAFLRAARSYEADTAKVRPADDAAANGPDTSATDAAATGSPATSTQQPGRAALA